MNLTSRLEPREIVLYHFLDSLTGSPWVGEGEGRRLLDIGTGAGFPGIPLKIARPGLEVVLLDSVRKKITFCREVIREIGLSGVSAEWGRAQELSRGAKHSGAFDLVTSRAVAKAAELAAMSLPFLRSSGSMILYKGKPDPSELDALSAFCARKNLAATAHPVVVPGLDVSRTLLLVEKSPRSPA